MGNDNEIEKEKFLDYYPLPVTIEKINFGSNEKIHM